MRDIEFRAYVKELNKILPVKDIDLYKEVVQIDSDELDYGGWRGFDRAELMEFTGLRDKNGREIYEGDIVREQRKRFKDKYFVVEWLNRIGSYSFQPVDKSATSWPCFNFGSAKNLEVIGDIYRNKELLEGK